MAKVDPHPIRRIHAGSSPAGETNPLLGGCILRLPVQDVVVSLMAIVQKAPHGGQKRHSVPQLIAFNPIARKMVNMHQRLGRSSLFHSIWKDQAFARTQLVQPVRGVHIPQSARGIFDIWFQVKQRVAKLCMALPGQPRQGFANRPAIAGTQLRQRLVL
jgi:hypothetical protein